MIRRIEFNWSSTEEGEAYHQHEVGCTYKINGVEKECMEIREHPSCGEGDRWFYDSVFSDGSITRVFNPSVVYYE